MPGKKETLPLSVTHPELAKEADGWDPTQYSRGSSKKVSWQCKLGHLWKASIANRTLAESGCPYCTGKSVLVGFNDLLTLNPQVAKDADGWDPRKFTAGSSKRMSWKCKLGHKWNAIINDRNRGNSCPFCTNKRVLSGFNDLKTLFPDIASQAFGWDASKTLSGSKKKLDWRCTSGHLWSATVSSRTSLDASCPICSGHKISKGFNDLATTHPQMASQADGWDPSTVQRGSRALRNWVCEKGHKWRTSPNSRTNMDAGCPTCAFSGFDPNEPGYLYFLAHRAWGMLQIGITNYPDKRLNSHNKLGWEPLEIRGPIDGRLARQWESAILRMLKAKGADLSNDKIAGKFDGYSEAWSKSTFEVASIKELMRLTEEFEEEK